MSKTVKEKKWPLLLIMLLVLSLLIAGCGGNGENTAPGKEAYKLGAVVDISGNSSSLGVPERDTLLMLVEQLNAKGGIDGHPVELTILDNKSDETEAVLAVKKLIEEEVLVVLGGSASGTSMAIVDSVQKAQVPMISMAAASSIVEPVGDRKWVFKTAQSDIVTVENILIYLKDKGLTKVAFLYMNNAYGDGGKQAFETAAAEAGIQVVAREKFEAGDKDMTPQLTRVRASGAQAAVVWAIPPSASIITKNFRDLGLSIPLIHSHGVGNEKFIQLAQGTADGVILPIGKLTVAEQIPDGDAQKQVLRDYIEQYQNKYGIPPVSFGGYAADAFNLAVKAIAKAGPDRGAIRDELEKTSGFVGVSGVFNLSPEDHNGLGVDSMVLVEIKDAKWQMLK